MRVVCQEKEERIIRTILLRHVNSVPTMTLQSIATEPTERSDQAAVVIDIYSLRRNDRALEDILSRINIEPCVASASWEKVQTSVA